MARDSSRKPIQVGDKVQLVDANPAYMKCADPKDKRTYIIVKVSGQFVQLKNIDNENDNLYIATSRVRKV
jgi:hypothetical protein